MADLVILSLGLLIHMWALPYSFKNLMFDALVRILQLAYAVTILLMVQPAWLRPTGRGLLMGAGVGLACLLFHAPSEELFYKGVFFTVLLGIWGPFTAVIITTALSAMVVVVSSRRTGL